MICLLALRNEAAYVDRLTVVDEKFSMDDTPEDGPEVAATALRSLQPTLACAMASRTTGTMDLRCSRDASSGTTPPYLLCTESWLATTEDRTLFSLSTTAAAVSSQLLSIASIRTFPGKLPLYVSVLLSKVGTFPRTFGI